MAQSRLRKRAPGLLPTQQAGAVLIAKNQLHNHTGTNRHQHVIGAVLHPLVAAWWRFQVMAAPIVDNILAVTIFRRKTVTAMKGVIRTTAATVVMMVVTRLRWCMAVATTIVMLVALVRLIWATLLRLHSR